MSEETLASSLPFVYRQAMSKHVAELGNNIVGEAFRFYQGGVDDQGFEYVLFNCQVEFTRLLQLFHNERIIHGMQQDVLSGAERILEDSKNRWIQAAPPVVPEPLTEPPTSEEERRDSNGPTASD